MWRTHSMAAAWVVVALAGQALQPVAPPAAPSAAASVVSRAVAPTAFPSAAPADEETLYVWRVYVPDGQAVERLTTGEWDVMESRGPDYLLILGDEKTARALRALGYTVQVDQVVGAPPASGLLAYYGGYRSVAEHEQHLAEVAAARPDLARLVDFGDSWRKTRGAANGHDLLALCVTRLRPGDCELDPQAGKSRFLLVAGVHARELVPPEIAWRWVDYLVEGYGRDPDVTALLEFSEMWVVPLMNPDGRDIVESGGNSPLLQRKNANTAYGNCRIPYIGVDLNRNASFQWGGAGSSGSPCDQIYRGPAPASEPETQAYEALVAGLFPDQRGPGLADAAPFTTTGIVVNLHSYGDLVMLPWDWTATHSPNDRELRSLAFRMSYFNAYRAGQSPEVLYLSSGTTEDWAYGRLGVPSFTFELGSSFMPSYSTVDSVHWPRNLGALLYAARVARQPYAWGLGPSALSATLSLTQTEAGQPVTLTAAIDDRLYNALGHGRPASQAIVGAEYSLDAPPGEGGLALPMAARDGAFNAPVEQVEAVVDTDLSAGRHTLFVRGQDAGGNWGPAAAIWLTITRTYTISGAVTDQLSGDPLPAEVAIAGSDPGMNGGQSVATGASGEYSLTAVSGPAYTLTVSAADYLTSARFLGVLDGDRVELFALLPLTATLRAYLPDARADP